MKNHANELITGLFEGNANVVEDKLNVLLEKYVSIRDFAVNAPKENYYHDFINGLLVNGISLIKEQKSNFESGNGYMDLIIKSRNDIEEIAILELKQTPDENGNVDLMAREAVEQIIRKKYAEPYIRRESLDTVNLGFD